MPKSILEIEVNDAQFRAYLDTFNRYQDQIKKMPDPWRETGQEATAVAATIAGMTLALDLHYDKVRKLAEAEKDEAEARKKADEEHKRRLEEESDIEKDNEARRRKTIEQTKQIAKNVADTAISMGKWALFDVGAGLIGGALGLWGLDKLVEGVGQERRLAQGFGVSTGERQAMSIQMSRYFDVNSNLENIAEAKAQPKDQWAFTAMGINPTGKDPAQLALEMATRARDIFIQGRGNEVYAGAHGLLQFYSMDELRRLQATPANELAASVAATRKDIGFGISDANSKTWQDFIIKVHEAGQNIENTFISKLAQLDSSGALKHLIDDFTKLALTVLDKIDFTKLGQALEKFASYIGSDQFLRDFKFFVDSVSQLASELVNALRYFNMIPDKPASLTEQQQRRVNEDQAQIANAKADIAKQQHDLAQPWIGPGHGEYQAARSAAIARDARYIADLNADMASIYGAQIATAHAARVAGAPGAVGGGVSGSNNPGNIRDPETGQFVRYPTMAAGIAAMQKQLLIDYNRHGQHTVAQIIDDPGHGWANEWQSGNTHASAMNYINSVSKAMGVSPDTVLNLNDPATLQKLVVAMSNFESGKKGGQIVVTVINQTGHSVAATANAAGR